MFSSAGRKIGSLDRFHSIFIYFCLKWASHISDLFFKCLRVQCRVHQKWKFSLHLLILMSFQTHMTDFLLWNIKGNGLKKVHAAIFYAMTVNGDRKTSYNLSIWLIRYILYSLLSSLYQISHIDKLHFWSICFVCFFLFGHHSLSLYKQRQRELFQIRSW